MTGWIVFWVVVTIIALELVSMLVGHRRIKLICDADMKLVEPGEVVTISYEVRNYGMLPVSFAGLSLAFDEKVNIHEKDEWKKQHVTEEWNHINIGHVFMLMPHHKFSGRLHVSFNTRGVHQIDRLYLETGDILGFTSRVVPQNSDISIVCTSKMDEDTDTRMLMGGIIGDISARRFIFEDPSLLAGYRDYTGREPMKQISWMQTARQNKLMVKQNDYTLDAKACVLVDMAEKDRNKREAMLVLTRTLCELLEERDIPYELISNGDLHTVPEGLGKTHLHLILKRIGLSRFACFAPFGEVIDKVRFSMGDNKSCLVVASQGAASDKDLERLRQKADGRVELFEV